MTTQERLSAAFAERFPGAILRFDASGPLLAVHMECEPGWTETRLFAEGDSVGDFVDLALELHDAYVAGHLDMLLGPVRGGTTWDTD
jgi:hypothetical protein